MEHEAFISGQFDTHFVKNYFDPNQLAYYNETEARIAALIAAKVWTEHRAAQAPKHTDTAQTATASKWKQRKNMR